MSCVIHKKVPNVRVGFLYLKKNLHILRHCRIIPPPFSTKVARRLHGRRLYILVFFRFVLLPELYLRVLPVIWWVFRVFDPLAHAYHTLVNEQTSWDQTHINYQETSPLSMSPGRGTLCSTHSHTGLHAHVDTGADKKTQADSQSSQIDSQ